MRNFYADRLAPNDPEARRDLGVALMQLLELGRVPPPQKATAQARGQALLQEALERAPNDPAGWLAYGDLLMRDGYVREAIRVLERADRQAPTSEYVLSRLAHLEGQRGEFTAVGGYLRRLIEVNPFEPIYRRSLALFLGRQKDWEGVAEQAEAWLRLDPFSSEARQMQVMSLLQRGRKDEAARAFETLRQLRPGNLAELEEWYARLSR
ncbi:MAG: tetratricopeptide repeat protein [Gemmataceae bacterium]